VDGIQGRVQLRSDVIEVNVYGFQHQAAVESILTNVDAKLKHANVDPRIPWLGNRLSAAAGFCGKTGALKMLF
jgi:hypothetical protein